MQKVVPRVNTVPHDVITSTPEQDNWLRISEGGGCHPFGEIKFSKFITGDVVDLVLTTN